ncbi:MAG: DUF3108 domain-containing protein [Candidatus Eisenbacteria bacterium]|uniref:DUF3108 domain-containing protein n=1 Tax=Eiseniibacteriota bacterium TaxID=2212470 RepID=A0A849SFV0_UNCEI|nr:DUF3108 domain-containing protein [Candidatus Eisenbacteria bacterium]
MLLILALVMVPPTSRAADSDADSSDAELPRPGSLPGTGEVLPAVPTPFRVGESLKFSVQYGFIKAGTAWLEVPSIRDQAGRPAFQLVARAESNGFFSRFYKVRNRIESVWDSTGHFSYRYSEQRREGGHRASNAIAFDYAKQQAVYQDGQTFPIPPEVQDALSSFYYTRTQPLPLGGSLFFDYHASRKSVPMEVRVIGRERVKTPAGEFDCIAIEPLLKAGGIFKNKGRLVIWITDDERRMPVLMRSKVTVGSISVVLVDMRTGA